MRYLLPPIALLLLAPPADARKITICGSETAIEIQHQLSPKERASDCWTEEPSHYVLDKTYDYQGSHIVSLRTKPGAKWPGFVVTTREWWLRR